MVQRQQRLRLVLTGGCDAYHDCFFRIGNPLNKAVKPGLKVRVGGLGRLRLGAEGLEGLDDLLRLRCGALRLEDEKIRCCWIIGTMMIERPQLSANQL